MFAAIFATGWVLMRLLPVLLFMYLAIVSTGFIHEAGHIFVGSLVGIDVSGFSATNCLLFQCRVYPLEPLEGWQGQMVELGGGAVASLWWITVYIVTRRWHRTEAWWLGAASATFLAGELTTSFLEGGFNWLYSNQESVALPIIFLALVGGFAGQLKISGQLYRIRQIWAWSEDNKEQPSEIQSGVESAQDTLRELANKGNSRSYSRLPGS